MKNCSTLICGYLNTRGEIVFNKTRFHNLGVMTPTRGHQSYLGGRRAHLILGKLHLDLTKF